jgi:hypothetical protein
MAFIVIKTYLAFLSSPAKLLYGLWKWGHNQVLLNSNGECVDQIQLIYMCKEQSTCIKNRHNFKSKNQTMIIRLSHDMLVKIMWLLAPPHGWWSSFVQIPYSDRWHIFVCPLHTFYIFTILICCIIF